MTPRGTDWSLALLVGLAFATGVLGHDLEQLDAHRLRRGLNRAARP